MASSSATAMSHGMQISGNIRFQDGVYLTQNLQQSDLSINLKEVLTNGSSLPKSELNYEARNIIKDHNENLYIFGVYGFKDGNLSNGGLGPGNNLKTIGKFIAKIDANANIVYIKDEDPNIQAPWYQTPLIATDSSGSLSLAVNIDNSGGMPSQDAKDVSYEGITLNSNRGGFVKRIASNGDIEWVTQVTGNDIYSYLQSIITDDSGNTYVYWGDINWWAGKNITKLDANGNTVWTANTFGGGSAYAPYASFVGIDQSGDPLLAADNGRGSPSLFKVNKDSGIAQSLGIAVSQDEWRNFSFKDPDDPRISGNIELKDGVYSTQNLQQSDLNINLKEVLTNGASLPKSEVNYEARNIIKDHDENLYIFGIYGFKDGNLSSGGLRPGNNLKTIGKFIAKIDANANIVYIKDEDPNIQAPWYQTPLIATDSSGSLSLAVNIDNSGGMPSQDGKDVSYEGITLNSNRGGFVKRIASNGDIEWVTQVTGNDIYSYLQSIITDDSGNTYVYWGDINWWAGKNITKLDAYGNTVWTANTFGGGSAYAPYASFVGIDQSGDPLLAADNGRGSPSLFKVNKDSGIAQSLGIAVSQDEWRNFSFAAPNTPPSGTPILSRSTKVGDVITIDKTSILDADNFAGYTPGFKYSWDVSSNGTTWTPLTTTDATDNNTTYTLTAAEIGKQIRGVVSYLDGYGTNESVASAGSAVTTAAVVRGNSLYTIVDGPSWTQAEANSLKLGGHLISINDASENRFLGNRFGADIWIGINDIDNNGTWAWSSGDPVTYTNWSPGQPDRGHHSLPQNYGVLWNRDSPLGWDNQTNDAFEWEGHRRLGIVETPFIRHGDSAYAIVQGPTWEEAEANAVKLGGHLVTIENEQEDRFLWDWTKDLKSAYGDWQNLLWTGLNDQANEGDWRWSSGIESNYRNWNGQPDDAGGQDYALSNWYGLGWNDAGSSISAEGIAEIILAPNNKPTGSPTLSGEFKAGQVITIDKTPIQDADNFTGYTPDFKYSWEVSSNGTTWTPLTTTDATDNNNTYTLSTAEVGKQVRGVVSYLDGYGTQESVATAGSSVTSARLQFGPEGGFLTLSGSAYSDPWQYVVIPDSPSLSISGEYTVASWVYRSNAGGDWRNLYDIPDAHLLEFAPNGGFDWRSENNNIDFNANGTVIPEGEWHHVAATMIKNGNGYIPSVYVDGRLVTSAESWQLGNGSNSSGVRDSSGNLYLGILWSQKNGNPDPWAGSIDDFKIWNIGLTAAEVQAVALNDSSIRRDNLVAEYTFNSDIGSSSSAVNQLAALQEAEKAFGNTYMDYQTWFMSSFAGDDGIITTASELAAAQAAAFPFDAATGAALTTVIWHEQKEAKRESVFAKLQKATGSQKSLGNENGTIVHDSSGHNNNGLIVTSLKSINQRTPGILSPITTQNSASNQEGVTLLAGTITADPDGAPNTNSFRYQWSRNNTPIPGATSSSYITPATGVGSYSLAITYTDAQAFDNSVSSPELTISAINNGVGLAAPITSSTAGLYQEGVTLTAGSISADPDGDAAITAYQWFRNNTPIPGATASAYTTTSTGAGSYKVAVSYTDAQGFSSTVFSPEQTLSAINNGVASTTAITSSTPYLFREGVTLSAGSLTTDPDGDGGVSGYQWYRDNTAIAGATSASYTTTSTGAGIYKVAVSYTDAQGFSSTVSSPEQSLSVVNNGVGVASAVTAENGAPFQPGTRLIAGSISGDPDGDATITGYQWFYNDIAISGAISSKYTTPSYGSGNYKVAISYIDAQGFAATVESPDQLITGGINKTGVASAITSSTPGLFQEGVTLSAGSISGDPDGFSAITAYQWSRNNAPIAGATASSYITPATGAGSYKVVISYRDGAGNIATVESQEQSLSAINNGSASLSPLLSSSPGLFQEGVTLLAGSLSADPDGSTAITAYQWFRNNTPIAGATASAYTTTATGAGTYKVAVSYTDAQGFSSTVESQEQSVTAAAITPTPPPPAPPSTPGTKNIAPSISSTLTAQTLVKEKPFSYTIPASAFQDPDSTLAIAVSSTDSSVLPNWISYDAATRTLTGTPTQKGSLRLKVTASDELSSVATPLTLNIREGQLLSSSQQPIRYQYKKDVIVPINYATTDQATTTGISFRVHFNSLLFSFDTVTGATSKIQADLFQVGAIENDTSNLDNDSTTDKFIPINISSFTGSIPSGSNSNPIKLTDLIFKATDLTIDPLTGQRDPKINFSLIEAAQGYGFLASSAALEPPSFSLDVDGDGLVTALGDGLMIIRKLFGSSFAGDALTNKAISPSATRTTTQIHDFIQNGIDNGFLDVDKDGKTTALGDGLMVIRRLFGAAFDGAALTNKAISPDSPYFNTANASSIVAANIDALKPTTTTTPVM